MTTAAARGTSDGPAPLIGRRGELGWLLGRHEQAVRGAAQLVLIEGETGIGKTRLATELLGEARRRGTTVVRGRCYEHLEYAYLPLRESLFDELARWVAGHDAVRADAAVLDRLLGDPAAPAPPGPADRGERTRQLLALTRLTIELARDRPLLLFVDDLHWADEPTVEFLRHLLFRFEDEVVPLLVVATVRTDLDARAAGSVARLRSEPRAASLAMHPLEPLEATELARRLAPAGLTVEDARRLAEAGGGNPLLIEALSQSRPTSRPPVGVDGRTAPPLTAAVDARFADLSEPARSVAQLAALLIPHCETSRVIAASDLAASEVEAAVDEAIAAGVLHEEDEQLGFTHPVYAHLAYTTIPPRRRRALHAHIAEVLLHDGEDDVRIVAHHLVGAGSRADPEVVGPFARRAGDLALAATAWGEASGYYEAALDAFPAGGDPGARAELHRLAGLGYRGNLQLDRAVAHFDAALDALGPDGDARLRTDLHTWRIRCAIGRHDLLDVVRDAGPIVGDLVSAVEHLDPALAAEALVELSQSAWITGDLHASEVAARRALHLATEAGNWEAYSRAAGSLTVPQWYRYELRESLDSLRDGVDHESFAHDEAELAGGPRFRIPLVLTWLGRLDESDEVARECCALAERVNYPLEEGLPLAALALNAVVRGDFDRAESTAHRALLVQQLSGYHWAAGLYLPALFAASTARGAHEAAREALDRWAETATPQEQWTIGLFRRYADCVDADIPVAGDDLPPLPRTPAVGADTWAALALEVARREGVAVDAARAYDLLDECERRGGVVVGGVGFLVPRVRAAAADLMGDDDTALAALDEALTVARRLGAGPEHARTLVDRARILLRRGERDTAGALLDDAVARFERLGMPREARRAAEADGAGYRRAHLVHPATPSSLGDEVVTDAVIFFTDVVDSTRLTEELGASRYRARAREVEALVASTVAACQGTIVTGINLGDGFIGLFRSVEQAIRAAQVCAREAYPTAGLHLHLGLHAGDILVEGDRIFGGPVNYAARVCAIAGQDEILASEVIRDRAASVDVAFVHRGEHTLKGIVGTHRLYAIMDADAGAPAP